MAQQSQALHQVLSIGHRDGTHFPDEKIDLGWVSNLPTVCQMLFPQILSGGMAFPSYRWLCSYWILGEWHPPKLCNTSEADQPVVIAPRAPVARLCGWHRGALCPRSAHQFSTCRWQGPTHLSLRRDAASEGRASASLQAPTSVMLFWDRLQGHGEGTDSGPSLDAPFPSAPLHLGLRQSWGTLASSRGSPEHQTRDPSTSVSHER